MSHGNFIKALFLCLIIFLSQKSYSANIISQPDTSDFYSANYLRNDNYVYQNYIQAVEFLRVGFELSDPVITLNTEEKFYTAFDDLQGSYRQYYYQVQHFSANWEKSDIWLNEYLEGLEEGQVEKFESSFNTRTIYTHYEFVFPNDRFILKKSGNYILRVFWRDNNGNEINAFTRRFMIVDPKVTVSAKIGRAGTSEDYETKQEVDFEISTTGFRIDAPYQDIKL